MNSFSSQMSNNYQAQIRKIKTKIIVFWSYMTGVFVFLSGLTFIFYHFSNVFKILFFIFLGIFVIFLIVLIMLSLFYVSEKPLYEMLYPKVVEDHNYENNTMITYHAYPKDKDFFEFGGLYPFRSTKVLRFKLSFDNKNGYHVDVYDAYVITSNGKTTNIHLNGYYLLFRDYDTLKFQLRTYGNPFVDPKYVKLVDITDVRAFVESSELDLDLKYIKLYHLVKNEYRSPAVALGCNGCDLHLGITLRPMRRHIKVLTEEMYQELRRSLIQMIDLANTIK